MKIITFSPYLIAALILLAVTKADFTVNGKVKKRNTIIKIPDQFPSACTSDISTFKNNGTFRRIVDSSKYIFVGKISSVQKRNAPRVKTKRVVLKVFLRRVLKGDIDSLSEILNFETRTSRSSNRGYVNVESVVRKGCGGQAGGPALFFVKSFSSPLQLLLAPVPSTLERVRRVKAVLKGK